MRPWSRLLTVGVALAVAAGVGLAAAAFLGRPEPTSDAPISPTPTPTRPAITTPSPDIEANHSDAWGAPTALSVTCTREGIDLFSTEVPAQPDGVHIITDNPGGARIVHAHLKGPPPVGIHDETLSVGVRPQGLARDIQAWPPGPVELSCHGQEINERRETVVVTDPQGLWISDALACEDAVPYDRGHMPYADLERTVRENVSGLLLSDEIVRAGYPQDAFPAATLVVVRDGEPLATVMLIYIDSEDFWMPSTGEICVGSGIMGA
jgi:hypothetical protein